jgi:hypothetical protein
MLSVVNGRVGVVDVVRCAVRVCTAIVNWLVCACRVSLVTVQCIDRMILALTGLIS